jgi:hypothetical protein
MSNLSFFDPSLASLSTSSFLVIFLYAFIFVYLLRCFGLLNILHFFLVLYCQGGCFGLWGV